MKTQIVIYGILESIDSDAVFWDEQRYLEYKEQNPDWNPWLVTKLVHEIPPEFLAKMKCS